ncbi:MAG: hypothetical protein Q9166_007167 [cf. Caloplaca sp. 2 TL-2023]
MAKTSFAVGAKHDHSHLTSTAINPFGKALHLRELTTSDGVVSNEITIKFDKNFQPYSPSFQVAKSPVTPSAAVTPTTAITVDASPGYHQLPDNRFNQSRKHASKMAEPPAKRAKRTDSAAMWDRNSKPTDTRDKPQEPPAESRRKENRERKDDKDRKHGRDGRDRRSRSRSRERVRDRDHEREGRRQRSTSRDRGGGRHVNGDRSRSRERDGKRRRDGERRDRDRSVSRDRHRSRRDDPPPRRLDRHRSRSRSPPRDPKSSIRTRSPPRGPSSKAPPSGPVRPSRTPLSPPPSKGPPKGPKATSSLPKTNGTTSSTPPNSKGSTTAPTSKMDIDSDSDPETAAMRRMMGFANFKSTKNTKVPGNDVYAVRKEKKTEYRQYMNRVGGFNRPLSPSR